MSDLTVKKGENGKYGFVDDAGNWVIEPRFTSAKRFESGFAPVSENYWWGILKQDGTWLVKPQYDGAEILYGDIIVYDNGIEGYVDDETGEIEWDDEDENDDDEDDDDEE